MDESDPGDRDERDERDSERRRGTSGFSLGLGLGPVSDLLGDVVRLDYRPRSEPAAPDERPVDDPGTPDDVVRPPRSDQDTADVADEFHVDAYRTEDELVVVGDLPGVAEADLSIGVDVRRNCLVVGVDDTIVERVSLPWESVVATKVTFNNAVLEIRLRPEDEVDAGDDP